MKVEGDHHISTELGTGTLPLEDYIQKGKEHNVKWFVVEQEHFTKTPVESAAQNAEEIKNMSLRINDKFIKEEIGNE